MSRRRSHGGVLPSAALRTTAIRLFASPGRGPTEEAIRTRSTGRRRHSSRSPMLQPNPPHDAGGERARAPSGQANEGRGGPGPTPSPGRVRVSRAARGRCALPGRAGWPARRRWWRATIPGPRGRPRRGRCRGRAGGPRPGSGRRCRGWCWRARPGRPGRGGGRAPQPRLPRRRDGGRRAPGTAHTTRGRREDATAPGDRRCDRRSRTRTPAAGGSAGGRTRPAGGVAAEPPLDAPVVNAHEAVDSCSGPPRFPCGTRAPPERRGEERGRKVTTLEGGRIEPARPDRAVPTRSGRHL